MGSWSDILWDKLANSSNVSGIKPEDNPSGIGPECGDMDKPDDFGDNPYNDKPYSKNYNDIKQPPKIASRDKLSYVVHQKGHHNSSGELAEWVVKSHDSGKIISSHKSKEEATSHLRDIEGHKSSAIKLSEWADADEPMMSMTEEKGLKRCANPNCRSKAILPPHELNHLTGWCHNCTEEDRARKRRSNMSFNDVSSIDELLKSAVAEDPVPVPTEPLSESAEPAAILWVSSRSTPDEKYRLHVDMDGIVSVSGGAESQDIENYANKTMKHYLNQLINGERNTIEHAVIDLYRTLKTQFGLVTIQYPEELAAKFGPKTPEKLPTSPEETEKLFHEFEDKLRHMDWYYQMSDDHRVWSVGQRAMEDLGMMNDKLMKVDAERTESLWNQYSPAGQEKGELK